MRQAIYALCAALLAIAGIFAGADAVSAAPVTPTEQVQGADKLLLKVEGPGGGYYGGGGYYRDHRDDRGYRGYRDDYAPPPPPRPRRHYKMDPGWGSDGTPRWRADRFTPEFCYTCLQSCGDGDGCAPRCWGWKRYCRRHGY